MKMKVLATSNGILGDGFASWLGKMDGVEVVANLSAGSSHPILIPVALARDTSGADCDVFVLDVCVNEQRARNRRIFNGALSREMFDHFVAACTAARARPLVLLLPVIDRNGRLSEETVDIWRGFCQEAGVTFLDAAAMARETTDDDGMRALWRDNHHPTADFSRRIAERLARMAQDLVASPLADVAPPSVFQGRIRLLPCPAGTVVERRTRLVTCNFRRITNGETFELSLPGGEDFTLLGLSFNMGRTHAALEFDGAERICQRLDSFLYDDSRPMWYVSWGLTATVASRDGRLRVTVRPAADDMGQLKNDHIRGVLPIPDPIPPVAEVENFVLRLESRAAATGSDGS